jgi:hypothetical protein
MSTLREIYGTLIDVIDQDDRSQAAADYYGADYDLIEIGPAHPETPETYCDLTLRGRLVGRLLDTDRGDEILAINAA